MRFAPQFCGRLARNGCPVVARRLSPQMRHYWRERSLWDPFSDVERSMNRMFREMERLSPFRAVTPWSRLFEPFREVPIETTEDGQRLYKIALDLGHEFKPENINVTVKDRLVTIKAKAETETDGCKQLRQFQYQYTLPEGANLEQVKSLLTPDGRLTIEAPLPPPKEAKATEIPINRGDDVKKIDK